LPHFETIRYELEGDLASIILARPDKRNAVNEAMFAELGEAVDMAGAEPNARALVVRGEGPSFCSGIDLTLIGELARLAATQSAGDAGSDTGSSFATFVRMAQRPFLALARMDKPTIAAVRGYALGAGCQLALACDLRIAATDARLGILEPRYGIIPDLGGAHHLTRLVGPARAKELIWSTRAVEADEALRIGMVNRVVAPGELDEATEAFAREVTAHSPTAVALVKRMIDRAADTTLEDELAREASDQAIALSSEDHREAVAAFLERRLPRYPGK